MGAKWTLRCILLSAIGGCFLKVRGQHPLFLKSWEAKSFLRKLQQADQCTTDELYCEDNKAVCYREYDREHWCLVYGTVCPPGMYCELSIPCFVHYETTCTDIDECASSPCQNGATCINGNNTYDCTCQDGYTGHNCEQNIDDCSRSPCLFGGTCVDGLNSYTCQCVPGYIGTDCEQDVNECASNPCQNGGTCFNEVNQFRCLCVSGYTGTVCDNEYNECESNPCQNGGLCSDGFDMFTCSCQPGFTGLYCEEDIDECASNPCLNGNICEDLVNEYRCECEEDFTGARCDTDMCLPGQADIVFLMDASQSQCASSFERQRQYVKHFVSQFPVGPTHVQFSVVTFSWNANIEFYLNTFSANTSVIDAIDNISCVDGPSLINKAFNALSDKVLQSINGARVAAYKYVIILSDGLFSDLKESVAARKVLQLFVTDLNLFTVAIGKQVLQHDLIAVTGDFNRVYPIVTDDALNAILEAVVHPGCPDCFAKTTDMAILLDASSQIGLRKFYKQIDAVKVLLKAVPMSASGVHISYSRFAAEVRLDIGFLNHTDRDLAISALQADTRNGQFSEQANVTRALEFVRLGMFDVSNGARLGTRHVLVLLTPGPISELDEVKKESKALKDTGVIIATVAIGEDADFASLQEVASDPALTFLVGENSFQSPNIIHSLVGLLNHKVCDMD